MTYRATMRRLSSACVLLWLGLALGLAALLPVLSGCGTSAPAASPGALQAPAAPAASPGALQAPAAPVSSVSQVLRSELRAWEGTPYRLGGTTRRGVDCSGLMQRLYRDALGVDLSRSTRSQVREGRQVRKSNLRAGDLVFFRPSRKGRHVGVYVGNGEFAHASTSAGPTISPLAREYWEDTYWTARRVLRVDADAAPSAPPAAPARSASTRRSERTGW